MSWFKKLKQGLSKSSNKITEGISAIVTKRKLDDAMLEELEELLIASDMGVQVAADVTSVLAKERFEKEVTDEEVKTTMAARITEILEPAAQKMELKTDGLHVILVVGVNGNGKTTTMGKLAHSFKAEGKTVMLAACDTFRAAAVEQLAVWAARVGCEIIIGKPQADPASVAYAAMEQAKAQGADVLMIDTAGRLQNKAELMEELEKITRVIKKADESAPHHTLLVLDATTGQNAHSQVDIFSERAGVNGLLVTKLDGTAKGGVVVALAKKYDIPIFGIGVGEGIDDLKPFNAKEYAESLVGLI
jgi:fused signal recognition particle receptor